MTLYGVLKTRLFPNLSIKGFNIKKEMQVYLIVNECGLTSTLCLLSQALLLAMYRVSVYHALSDELYRKPGNSHLSPPPSVDTKSTDNCKEMRYGMNKM